MTVKEIAKEVIDTLPNEANMDEIIHALYESALKKVVTANYPVRDHYVTLIFAN